MLNKAIRIVAEAFDGKYDKGGKPYFMHCYHVMMQMDQSDEELCCIALMHDLIEDTDWTLAKVRELGFSERVCRALDFLTHYERTTYDNYITGISYNEDARIVKLADLRHNSDITRMKGLTKKDFERLEKYHRAYNYLKEV